jgi:uridine kinase
VRSIAIAVAGASCSGKTTLAEALAESLDATLIRIDDYYRPLDHLTYEERCEVNFDHPDSIDHEFLTEHVRDLLQGRSIEAPRYDFTRHARFPVRERIVPAAVLIVEGLFTLTYPELAAMCEVRIFVEAPENVCLDRRIARDVRERGRTPDEVVHRFRHDVWPMYLEHVLPFRDLATVLVDGEEATEVALARVTRSQVQI